MSQVRLRLVLRKSHLLHYYSKYMTMIQVTLLAFNFLQFSKLKAEWKSHAAVDRVSGWWRAVRVLNWVAVAGSDSLALNPSATQRPERAACWATVRPATRPSITALPRLFCLAGHMGRLLNGLIGSMQLVASSSTSTLRPEEVRVHFFLRRSTPSFCTYILGTRNQWSTYTVMFVY
jgi:hypothetical protein